MRNRLEKFFKDNTDEIIDEFISFHYIPTDKIPIDLFSLEGCEGTDENLTYSQASRLLNVLTAASKNLGDKQINTLTEKLKEVAKLITTQDLSDTPSEYYNKKICNEIINILTARDMKDLDIDDHLITILNFIKNNMIHQTWGDFFESQKKIVVITTGKERTKIGTNLIDLMLASLYTYKTYTNTSRISVIIDEISFLNLSGSGTISKLARASRQTKISLMLASQDFMKEKLNEYIGNFNIKIFFKPTDCNIVAGYINSLEIDSSLLNKFETGECVVVGNLYNKFKENNCHSILSGRTAEFIGSQYFPIETPTPYTEINTENEETPDSGTETSVEIVEVSVSCTEINDEIEKTSFSEKFIKTTQDTQVDTVTKTYLNVKVLIEDTKDETMPKLACENGLSFYIEYNNKKILLDFGRTGLFADNAWYMGIDLETIDFAVLSHAYIDHSGGFTTLLDKNPNIKIHARQEITENYYDQDGEVHLISAPRILRNNSNNCCLYVNTNTEIYSGIHLIGHSAPNLSLIGEKNGLYKFNHIPDNFMHEQSLVFDTPNGLIIFNSCSNGGVDNIIQEVKYQIKDRPIYAYIGGFHIINIKKDEKEKLNLTDDEIAHICDIIKKKTFLMSTQVTAQENADFRSLKNIWEILFPDLQQV